MRRPAQVITKLVEKVEVIPHDYEEIKFHLEQLSNEYEILRKRPPQVITKVEKLVEKVEVYPEDYEEIKMRI